MIYPTFAYWFLLCVKMLVSGKAGRASVRHSSMGVMVEGVASADHKQIIRCGISRSSGVPFCVHV